jgi:hypothetical protein
VNFETVRMKDAALDLPDRVRNLVANYMQKCGLVRKRKYSKKKKKIINLAQNALKENPD